MDKHTWVTWLMFLQTTETLPQNDEEEEIANGELLEIGEVWWEVAMYN